MAVVRSSSLSRCFCSNRAIYADPPKQVPPQQQQQHRNLHRHSKRQQINRVTQNRGYRYDIISKKHASSAKDSATSKLTSWTRLKDTLATGSVLKSLASLNIDLPTKYLPDYQKFLPSAMRIRSPPQDAESEAKNQTGTSLSDLEKKWVDWQEERKFTQEQEIHQQKIVNRAKVEAKIERNGVNRERHDFETAMSDMARVDLHDSIHQYYSSVSSSDDKALNKGLEKAAEKKEVETIAKVKSDKNATQRYLDILNRMEFSLLQREAKDDDTAVKPVVKEKVMVHKELVAKPSIDKRTRELLNSLKKATSLTSQLTRMEDFNQHLNQYLEAKPVALKEKAIPLLLKLGQNRDRSLKEEVRLGLALLGQVDPVKGTGIRVLSLDGGGTKGLITIEVLKKLEEKTGKQICELFDYVCGVSTGSLIAAMVCMWKVPLEECEALYRQFSLEMFQRNRFVGTGKLVLNHAYYDSQIWENILKNNMGNKTIIESSRDAKCPKYSAVSSITNVPRLKSFLFRNYSPPPGVLSHYPGTCRSQVWEAIRASSAAPGYFEEFHLGEYEHQDGGLLANNPTAIAIHECKLLWPNESLACVVSLGTGRYEPTTVGPGTFSGLKNKITKVIDSATDTEVVHTTLQDLLPPSCYFRFNPYMSEDFLLDEIRDDKIEQMQHDAQLYLRKNQHKMNSAIGKLTAPRRKHQLAGDWLRRRAELM